MLKFCKASLIHLCFALVGSGAFAQSCFDLNPSGVKFFGTTFSSGQCSQVTQNIRYQFSFSTPTPATGTIQLLFSWGDGSGNTVVGLPNNVLSYDVTQGHAFPVNSDCEYLVRAAIFVQGAACPSTQQQVLVNSYRTEAFNQGLVQIINPVSGTNIFDVCPGQNISTLFNDLTIMNCNESYVMTQGPLAGQTITNPNALRRWTQFVYNTQTTAGTRIPNVFVNGVQVTNAAGAPLQPGPNFYQDPRGIFVMNPPVTAGTPARRNTLTITAAGGYGPGFPQVGNIFEITLRYWNVCNPYDDPLIPGAPVDAINGDNPPITGVALIRIIPDPPILSAVAVPDLCYGTALTNANTFAVSGNTGSTTAIRWYNGNPLAGGAFVANPLGTNSSVFRMSAYPASAPGGPINTSRAGGAGGVYALWATQVYGGINGCESQPVQVIRIVRPQLTSPAAPTGIAALCNNTSNVAYSQAAASPSTTIPANTFTNTIAINYTTEYFWTANPPAGVTLSATTGTSINANFSLTEPAPSTPTNTNINIETARRYTTAPQCTTTPGARTVNVSYSTVGGTISPTPRTICDGSATGAFTLTGYRGTINSWYRVFNAGVPIAIAGTAGLTNWAGEVPPNGAGNYEYYAEVQNGVNCAVVNSSDAIVTVNPVPPQPTIGASGPTTFCNGGTVTLTSSNTLASSYQWFRNGVPVVGATSQNIVLNTVGQSGSYTVQTFGVAPSNCPSPVSAATVVTINPLPVVSGPIGGGAVCTGLPAPDIVFTVTGGTGPYTGFFTGQPGSLNYGNTVPGYPIASTPGVSQTSTSLTLSNPVTVSNGNFILLSLVDSSTGCAASSLGGTGTIIFGGAPPAFSSGPSLSPTATCFNGGSTTDPQLIFTLDPGSASLTGFTLTYRIDGGSNLTKTFNTNAASVPTAPITFNEAALNNTIPSPHVIRLVSIISPSGCLSTFNLDLNFTVNPLPNTPTGPVSTFFCSSGPPAPISATPAPGSTIDWYAASSGGSVLAGGAGTSSFTPSAAGTYFAESRNTTTGCVSATRLAVTSTMDNAPAAAVGGPNQNICVTSVTMAATPANNGGSGQWTKVSGTGTQTITTPNSATTTITGLVQPTPGSAANVYVFRWTVSSALFPSAGSCPQTTSDVTITVNSLPTSTNPLPQLCETVFGGNQTTGVDLTSYNAAVTSHPSGITTVAWFSDAARTIAVPTPTNVTVVGPTRNFFWRSTDNNGCQNIGTITFAVNSRPAAATQTRQYCEDVIGGGVATSINLNTEFNTAVTGGAANRSVVWFTDAALTVPVATPTSFGFGPAPVTLFAQVTNTLTGCTNSATVNLSIKPKPTNNPILGNASVCTGNSIILYQLNPALNPGSTYTWSIVGTPAAAVQVFGGGGTNSANFFALLQFPSATGSVAIQVTETLNGCVGTPSNMTVTVNSAPAPNTITGPLQVCANQTGVNYAVTSPNGTSTYTWTVTGATVAGSAGDNINVDFSTVSPVVVRVAETAISGCVGADATINVTVNPRPVMTSPTTITSCSGTIPVSNFTASLPSNFAWTVPPGGITGAITGTTVGSSGIGNLSETLVNTSGAVGSVTYNVTPTAVAAPSCAGSPQTVTVTVNPEPVLVSPQTKTICSGDQVNYQILLNPLNLPAGTAFTWSAPTMSDASVQGTGGTNVPATNPLHIIDVLTNTTAAPITATYTITPSVAGCPAGTARTVVITVNPAPRVATTLNATKCSVEPIGLTLALAPSSAPTSGYNIISRSVSPGLTPGTGNAVVPSVGSVAANYLANDSYKNVGNGNTVLSVTYRVQAVGSVGGCLSAPLDIVISINPEPALSNSLDRTVCSGDIIGLTLSTAPGSANATTFNVNGVTIPGGLTPGGTNAIVPTGTPQASNYLLNDRYTNLTGGTLTVVYQVVPVSTLGNCPGDPPKSISINVLPEPVINPVTSVSVCPSQNVGPFNFTANTGGGENFTWTNDNTVIGLPASGNGNIGAFAVNGNLTGVNQVANITVNATKSGCASSTPVVFQITVRPQPVINAVTDISVCPGQTIGPVNFVANTGGGETFAWTNDNTTIGLAGSGTGPISSYTAPANVTGSDIVGNINVTATRNGCVSAAMTFRITVKPQPILNAIADVSRCPTELVGPFNFVANTGGGETIAWTNDNAAIGIAASGTGSIASYSAPANLTGAAIVGNITVTATKNGCTSPVRTFVVTIKPQPVLSPVTNIAVCPGQTVGPVNFAANTGGGETFAWTNSNISIGLGASGSGDIGSFLAPLNNSGSPFVGNLAATATLNSCVSAPVNFTITVNPTPVVSAITDIVRCPGSTVPAINFAANSGGGETFTWTNSNINIGLPANGTGNIATYTAPSNLTGVAFIGTISVTATKNGCTSSATTFQIRIDPQPVINPIADVAVCPGQSIGPINFTSNTGGGETFTWTNTNTAVGLAASGVGNIATYIAPTNTTGAAFVGTVTVTATRNGCVSTVRTFTITVNPQPIVTTIANIIACPGQTIGPLNFTSNAGGGETFTWTNSNTSIGLAASGTGSVASWTAPANNTGVAFVSTISVIATRNGCASSPMNFQITVNPQPVVATQTNIVVCPGATVGPLSFLANTGGSETFNWTNSNTAIGLGASGSGTISSFVAASNVTGANVVGTISVTATKNGCTSLPMTFTITVQPNPVVAVVANVVACPSQSIAAINFSANTGGGETFNWTNNNTSIGLAASGTGNIASFTAPANLTGSDIVGTVSVTATRNGCTGAVRTFTITISPQPVVNTVANVAVCAGQSISAIPFSANTGGGETFSWTNTNTAIGLAASGTGNIAAYTAPANLTGADFVGTINVTATRNGCVSTAMTFTITVRAQPVVAAVTNIAVCSGPTASPVTIGPINFTANTGGGETFNWTNTNGSIGLPLSGTGNIAAYNAPANTTSGNFVGTISVTATRNGCSSSPPVSFTITVRPRPVMSASLDKAVCSGQPFAQNLATDGVSIGATNYNVVAVKDPALVGTATSGNNLAANALAADSFVNTTSVPLTVVYTVTPNGTNGCVGDPRTVTLTVNPEPVLINPGVSAVCSGDISNITLATNGTSVGAASYVLVSKLYSTDGGTTYAGAVPANFVDAGNVPVTSSGNNTLIRNDKYTNTRAGQVIVRYQIRPISPVSSSGACNGATVNFDLPVNPQPILDPALNPTPVCSGVASGVTLGVAPGSVGAVTYNINSITFPGLTAGSGNTGIGSGKLANAIFNDVYVNTTASPVQAIYSVVPVSAAGCLGAPATVTLTINPSPALLTGLDRTVCSTDVSGITFGSQGTSVPATTYNIISVTINPSLTQTAGNTGARTGVGQNEIVNDRFQNPTNIVRTVVYRIEPVSAAGCRGPQVDITLSVEPTVTMITPPNASICSDTPNTPSQTNILLNSNTVPSAGAITFDYTAVATPPGSVTGFFPAQANLPINFVITDRLVNNTNAVATVTYTITPKAVGAKGGVGCIAPTTTVVTITVDPKPRLSITPATQIVCEGVATTMTLSSSTVPSAGTIQFTKISAVPTGGMTLTSAPKTTYLNGEQIGDVWDNPTTLAQTVTYTFRASVVGGLGCISEDITALLTVNPSPTVAASTQPPICSSDFINITLTPDVANTICNYSVAPPPVISGATSGAGNLIFQTLFYNSATPTVANSDGPVTVNYTVTPRANNCNGPQLVIPVVVNPKPKILPLPNTFTICHGNTLTIPLLSNVVGANYTWTVDNPSNLPGIVEQPVVGPSTGISQVLTNTTGTQATLTYTIKAFGPGATPNQCEGDQKIIIVTVAPQITASFTNNPVFMCKGRGSDILIVEINGQAPFSFVYNQNDGTTSTNISVTNAGNFKVIPISNLQATTTYTLVSVQDAFGCPVTITAAPTVVTVNDVDATFVLTSPAKACSPYTASFTYNQVAQIAPGVGPRYTWQWRDGTRDIIDSVFTVTAPGSTIQHTFTNLSPSRDQPYNANLFVQLDPNVYPFNGCAKNTTQTVTVNSIIITNVNPDRTDLCSGDAVRMINQSLGVTSHRWFWRLVGSTAQNDVRTTPTVTYNLTNTGTLNPQPVEIVYQANNGNCPAPDVVTTVNVYKGVTASFNEGTVPPFNSGSSTVTFTNTSTPFDLTFFRYDWTFGIIGDAAPNFLTQTAAAPLPVTYSSPGSKEITLIATNIGAEAAGVTCTSEFRKTITIVLPPLQASFDVTPVESCFPSTIKLVNVVGTGFVHDWRVLNKKTGASFSSNVADPGEFKITTPGEYTISYRTSIPSTGQVATAPLRDVKIYDKPLASFDLRPDIVFVPDTEMITFNFSEGANAYDWDFGDGGTSILKEPVYTYKIEGKYDVTLVASFDHGNNVICRDTLVRKVTAKLGGQSRIPNAFTPNPNGPSPDGRGGNGTFNDVFLPIVRGIADEPDAYNLQVFDRWGNLLFESNSSTKGWDGYDQNGKIMPAGVYVYKLTLRFSDTQRTTQVGDVTLIR
jgi:gliding motility-associated-like protein